MTRINVIHPSLLVDKHLLAEHRELTRIPNTIVSGKAVLDGVYPNQYILGKGHVKFFYNKLKWLHRRYDALHSECQTRGFNVSYKWPANVPSHLYNDYQVKPNDVKINIERVLLRLPVAAKMYGIQIDNYSELLNKEYSHEHTTHL